MNPDKLEKTLQAVADFYDRRKLGGAGKNRQIMELVVNPILDGLSIKL